MNNDPRKLFGQKGDADKILEEAKANGEQVSGQTRSAESLRKAQERLAGAETDHMQEAAAGAEDIIAYLNDYWNEREFTPEQRIFSVALATVNLRQNFPKEKGGTDEFDRVAHEAWKYWKDALTQVFNP